MPDPSQLFGGFAPAPSAVREGADREPEIDFAAELGLPANPPYTAPAPPTPQERTDPAQAIPREQHIEGEHPAMGSPYPAGGSFIDLDSGVVVINGVPGPILPDDLKRLRSEAMKAAGRAWTIAAEKEMHENPREGEQVSAAS